MFREIKKLGFPVMMVDKTGDEDCDGTSPEQQDSVSDEPFLKYCFLKFEMCVC